MGYMIMGLYGHGMALPWAWLAMGQPGHGLVSIMG
jgi:hypothetical protein